MKCQCNKSNIMISAELHRSGLSASDDVLVFSSDYEYADCKIINKNHLMVICLLSQEAILLYILGD